MNLICKVAKATATYPPPNTKVGLVNDLSAVGSQDFGVHELLGMNPQKGVMLGKMQFSRMHNSYLSPCCCS